jgi:hypothetical protein
MYFIQDLSRFYSVLAIEEGSKERLQAALKRNIRGEIYEGSTFIEDARNWLLKAGYSHIYMIGYSVGAVAAAREGIRESAGRWQSPNGMILITTPKDKTIWHNADKLQGNMLLLYGEKMTRSFIEAGNDLINKTPDEGHQNLVRLNKKIIILPEVAHEVWTVAERGTYSSKATTVIVEFIEESKVLYYLAMNERKTSDTESKEEGFFIETFVEPCLNLKEPMRLRIKIEGLRPDNYTFIAKPLIEGMNPSVTKMVIFKDENEILLIFNQIPKKQFKFELFSYSNPAKYLGTYETACKSSIKIRATKSFNEIPILVDGVEYKIGKDGKLELETYVGKHIIEAPLNINLSSKTRIHFKGWADGSNNTRISIETPGNTDLLAIYTKQFEVEGYSERGSISGNGWYDENSLSNLNMKNKIIEDDEGIFIFEGWNINGEDNISEQIYVTGPIKTEAKWLRIELPIIDNKFELIIPLFFLIFSITIFSITISLAKKHR